jgi:hypothetical protein
VRGDAPGHRPRVPRSVLTRRTVAGRQECESPPPSTHEVR